MARRPELFLRLVTTIAVAAAFAVTLFLVNDARIQSQWNREVLCIGILSNTENPARDVPRVQELCTSVGVTP